MPFILARSLAFGGAVLLILAVAVVALAIIVLLLGIMTFQLVLQNGRLLERVETLEDIAENGLLVPGSDDTEITGLPVGVAAPAFELPDPYGVPHALAEWRGRRVLLIFFDPDSGFCRKPPPALAGLSTDVQASRPTPLILTTGDADTNRTLFEEAGVAATVLLLGESNVAGAYFVDGAPVAYLIETDGTIASEMAVGAQSVLVKAGETAPTIASATAGATDVDQTAGLRRRPLELSKINREGLPAGTEAPIFRLPRLDGGELSLLDYRGKRVLLVFSDPDCGPCSYLAPDLEKLHQRAKDLSVVMISRGSVEANNEKVKEHGLTMPVVLQRHWEISREYGMFATPIGFLVDEWGILSADVGVGPEAILALGALPADGKEESLAGKR